MRSILPSLTLLLLLAGFVIWNSCAIETNMAHCITLTESAQCAAHSGDWPAAKESLNNSHARWQSCRSYLFVTIDHDVIDAADAMYHRAMAFAETEEQSEFQAETAGLRIHLLQLAEQEQLHMKNIF